MGEKCCPKGWASFNCFVTYLLKRIGTRKWDLWWNERLRLTWKAAPKPMLCLCSPNFPLIKSQAMRTSMGNQVNSLFYKKTFFSPQSLISREKTSLRTAIKICKTGESNLAPHVLNVAFLLTQLCEEFHPCFQVDTVDILGWLFPGGKESRPRRSDSRCHPLRITTDLNNKTASLSQLLPKTELYWGPTSPRSCD